MKRSPKREDVAEKVSDCVESDDVRLSDHAESRMREQGVFWEEVKSVLSSGWHVPEHDKWDEEHRSWNYAIEGATEDGRELRVPVAFVEFADVVVVTVIDSPH